MIVLGITNDDLSGACLVKDGAIVAAVSEERFTRRKEHKVWPSQSITYVLRQAKIDLQKVDYVSYGWCAGFNPEEHLPLYFDRIVTEVCLNPEGLPIIRQRILDEMANDKAKRSEFDDFIARHKLGERVVYIDHHLCHALGAFVCSPFDDAVVMTCDGRGDFQSLTLSVFDNQGMLYLYRGTTIDSLGYFYGRITSLLGYKANRHEGKITGLAALGDPTKLLPLMQQMIVFEDGAIRAISGPLFKPSYNGYDDKLKSNIARERPEDVAAAAQCHIENLLGALLEHHVGDTRLKNLCLAGGVFGNVKLNQRLRQVRAIDNVYVLPCMGDGGLALAAAVGVAFLKNGTRFRAPSMLLGPDLGDTDALLTEIATFHPDVAYTWPDDMVSAIVEALSRHEVVGLVRGRMEFGPRALCNRSILCHAADKSVNTWLNERMSRTEFMPFAPVTAIDDAEDCYVDWRDDHLSAEFMTMTYACRRNFREACPAVVHVDGTARPQIVRPESDPFMHRLLSAWKQASGQLALINTSFNRHEEPIVCTLNDALQALRDDMVDLVVLNEKIICRASRRSFLSD